MSRLLLVLICDVGLMASGDSKSNMESGIALMD